MDIKIQQARLNVAHKKIAKSLADPLYLSEWMCDRGYPWLQVSFIDFRLDIDLREIENVTDEEIYELVRNKLITNFENILYGLKK